MTPEVMSTLDEYAGDPTNQRNHLNSMIACLQGTNPRLPVTVVEFRMNPKLTLVKGFLGLPCIKSIPKEKQGAFSPMATQVQSPSSNQSPHAQRCKQP